MGGPIKPYMQGAGPIPNDEYGTGHMQVDPRFSQRTNYNIANQSPGDANLAGLQEFYGSPQYPPEPYTEGIYPQDKGLSDQQWGAVNQQGRSFDQTAAKMRQLFGDESAAAILDEVMRLAASQDVNGPMAQPDFSRMPSATPKMDPMSVMRQGAQQGSGQGGQRRLPKGRVSMKF